MAEQLRAAGLSISNNIAEGSGSVHKQEFIQFLNITRRSLFEDASMLLVFEKLGLLESAKVDDAMGLRRREPQDYQLLLQAVTRAWALYP